MNINIKHEDGISILELEGDVDLSCSPEARKHILEALQDNKNLLINLADVTYIDSSGIASLVEGYQTAKKHSLDFALLSASEAVMSVLQLARLDKVFPIFDTLEAYKSKS